MSDDRSAPDGPDGDSDAFDAITQRVLERVTPDTGERARLEAVARELTERARRAATDRCPDADVIQVGSSARNTWISGDRDIDIFVRFPPDLDRATLETFGLEVGHETLPEGHEEFAEHPYVKGEFDGFAIDIVPCYRLERARDIQSAVDRTPFHNRYLEARLDDELERDVRLTKAFLKGIGAYGSNLRTEGFSGYLTELLVVEYGGFRALLEAAADWNPPVTLDPEDHGEVTFDDPLIVIDPTDPTRNVAAVCAPKNVARLQHYAREQLTTPRLEYFEPTKREPLDAPELSAHLERRETTPVAVQFDAPDIVDDQLYPQLKKSLAGIMRALNRRGFDVLRGATFADTTAVIFLELSVSRRPAVTRHQGPPVHVRKHAEGFFDAYDDDPTAYGPFIDGDRYVVERPREFTSALAFLESNALFDASLGAHVETALEADYTVRAGPDVVALADEFGEELRQFFEPVP